MRLKAKDLPAFKGLLYQKQNGLCAICHHPFKLDFNSVLDHDHVTGLCRGLVHRNCNSLLGKLETYSKRYPTDLTAFLHGVQAYLQQNLGVLHCTHKTSEEKKALLAKRRKRKLK